MHKICPYVKYYLLTFVHFFTSTPVKMMHKSLSCRSTFSYSVMSHFPGSKSGETEYHNMDLGFPCKSSMFRYKLP